MARGADDGGLIDLESLDFAALDLQPEAVSALRSIRSLIDARYREAFLELTQVLHRQASAIDRMQRTLDLLLDQVRPELKARTPPLFSVSPAADAPDVARAVVIPDPIGAGYTLTQADVAQALGISSPEASVLLRAFGLRDDHECAVCVREGKKNPIYGYHERVIQAFMQCLAHPPVGFPQKHKKLLARVRDRLIP